MNKSELNSIIEKYNLAPNKKLGQNFLINGHIIEKIQSSVSSSDEDKILEIGPGLGAISEGLAQRKCPCTLVEYDSGIVRYLSDHFRDYPNVKVVHGDFLKIDLPDEYSIIVSNLPYYCASEILFRLATAFSKAEKIFVMMQKEMADRILSFPGSRMYGAMTVTLSLYFKAKRLFPISGGAFYPRPEVQSVFLSLKRRNDLVISEDVRKRFHLAVRSAFWGRRKQIISALSSAPYNLPPREVILEILQKAGISPQSRAEELNLEDYLKIAGFLPDGCGVEL